MNNRILLGQAEELPEAVRREVQRVIANEGFWIATDVNQPGADIPLVSMGGKVYSLKIDNELPASRFLKSVRFQGPYRGKHT